MPGKGIHDTVDAEQRAKSHRRIADRVEEIIQEIEQPLRSDPFQAECGRKILNDDRDRREHGCGERDHETVTKRAQIFVGGNHFGERANLFHQLVSKFVH